MSNQTNQYRERAAANCPVCYGKGTYFDQFHVGTLDCYECDRVATLCQQVAAESAPQWIPVSDLPKKSGYYLAPHDGVGREVYFYAPSQRWYWKGGRIEVTHWMPLPTAAPEKGEGE